MAKVARISKLQDFKNSDQKFACLTTYDRFTAEIFDQAGVDVLLVGDSAAENHLGHESVLAITLDEMIMLGKSVTAAAKSALVVVDMPFGSYEASPEEAVRNATRIMKETGAAAVKLEGGRRSANAISRIVEAGVPVMGHIGFTPQSVHALGGFKVQGRGEKADEVVAEALAVQAAGAFAVVLELIPDELAARITSELNIPTIGIGAGSATDGQVLVWTDFAGLSGGKQRKFVRKYLELRELLGTAAADYVKDVKSGAFPSKSESFEN
ncbi:MAG: 3-methyl-2-oxobutanoate hydroxymethyltransferase [Micrococcales bacterium]